MKESSKPFLIGRVTLDGMVKGADGARYWMRRTDIPRFREGTVKFERWYNPEANAWYAINLREIAEPSKPLKRHQQRYW